ncbi:MAG: DUF362 domain-containing protein [Dysgonamonadaceae bacterium]|jgi:uncharacterized protein (DUF362 family)|nr:DUF362 domain-containing protein [Dysgonamonadaceae bacterium]
MKRRDFLRTTLAAGAAVMMSDSLLANPSKLMVESTPDMVAVKGGEPAQMLQEALKTLGGIGKYVKKGHNVVIKPNIGWDKKPEFAADTNPELVGELVKQCLAAGARKVTVFDHTCDNWQRCYNNSGIKQAVESAGGVMVPGNDPSYYKEIKLPKAVKLKSAKIHQALLEADVWFNVPILKNHDGARMSIAMKNYMGIVEDRPYFHSNDLQQCIADICTWDKKPALNIIDAYRCLLRNGPQGRSVKDAYQMKALIVSKDIVAADTAAIRMFNQVEKISIDDVGHIANGEKLRLGTQKIDQLNIKRINI